MQAELSSVNITPTRQKKETDGRGHLLPWLLYVASENFRMLSTFSAVF